MRYFIEDVLVPIAVIVVIIVTVAATIFGITYAGNRIDCSAFASATGAETKFAGFSCYVQVEGKFVPMEQYKIAFERNLNIKVNQ